MQQREGAALDYLRWVLGQRQFNAAPRQTHRYKHLWQKAGGFKKTPAKKHNAKIGPLKKQGFPKKRALKLCFGGLGVAFSHPLVKQGIPY